MGFSSRISALSIDERAKSVSELDSITGAFGDDFSVEAEPASICPSVDFLTKNGIPKSALVRAQALADENGTTAAVELIAYCGIEENTYYQLLAKHIGVPFAVPHEIDDINLPQISIGQTNLHTPIIWGWINGSGWKTVLAPDLRQIDRLRSISLNDVEAQRLAITSPTNLRAMMLDQCNEALVKSTSSQLATEWPEASAKHGARAWQGAAFTLLLVLSLIAFVSGPSLTTFALHAALSVFFFLCVIIRLLALVTYRTPLIQPILQTPNQDKPTYSVMVPLKDEAAVVPDLVATLKRLKWPRSKLEIKLICEANDKATLHALGAEQLDPRFEIIRAPEAGPKTKPNALSYALAFATGTLITVYDAEDRPHPEQLLEAHAAFNAADERLACVQAPLRTANPQHNLWTTMFHFEYAGLFNGLLPWLTRRRAPIMLGGTSNHFRRSALVDVGGWDPYNVTEDADLGLRFWRLGYQTDMISRPTLEDAPLDYSIWLPQRTRWFKGWMQTWIVHLRRPGQLWRNMPSSSFLITQVLLTGTIVSALLHPFFLINAIILAATVRIYPDVEWLTPLVIFDLSIVFLSYVGFMALCWRATLPKIRRKLGLRILLTPIYWIAISLAAWRALHQLLTKPFYWEKTAHLPHEKDI